MNSRRKFLKSALMTTAGMGCYAGLGLQLSAMKAFASQSRFNDHKALVCVFLYGGNDSFNMLIPTDAAEYQSYVQTRQQMAQPLEGAIDLSLDANQFSPQAMPSSMSSVAELFNNQRLSIVSNIGPLLEPATKQQLVNDPNKLPPLLFSHNSQQSLWQTAGVDAQLTQGWFGRMADLLQDTNTPLPMNIGIGNTDILSAGDSNQPLVLNDTGPENFALLSSGDPSYATRLDIHEQILALANTPMQREYSKRIRNARNNNELVELALANKVDRDAVYPSGNPLAAQLKMVADMISVQSALNQPRQLFFVSMGGWDTHDDQVEQHAGLLATLSEALSAFNTDLDAMGKSEEVTTVTLSEFGRTLTSNGDGTDHGWAGHQFVMGGAVDGGKIKGYLPLQQINTDDDYRNGRIIPTTAIEQLGAELGSWFGLSMSEINEVFPDLQRFDADALSLFS